MVFRLPLRSRAAAVALATLGYQVVPKAYRDDGKSEMSVQWFCDSGVEEAQKLLDSAEEPRPALSLRATAPEHPYLVCLYWQEAHSALRAWLARSHSALPAILHAGGGSRLLRACASASFTAGVNLMGQPGLPASCAVPDARHAAAALVCGFVPAPRLTAEGHFLFPLHSLTFPGLTLTDLQSIREPGSHVLGDYAPGEHPACYALQCAANLRGIQLAENAVLRNPVHMLRGEGSRSALMSEALIAAPDSHHRDRLRLHLAGLT